MPRQGRHRPGDWLVDESYVRGWIVQLKEKAASARLSEYALPIRQLREMVSDDPVLSSSVNAMFIEASYYSPTTPIGTPDVENWDEFLGLLNQIVTMAPQFYVDSEGKALAMVGFPINAILDWPMGTAAGYAIFSNPKFNKYLKRVLQYWSRFLNSEHSRYVLAYGDPSGNPRTIAWLSKEAKKQMVKVAMQPCSRHHSDITFEDVFVVPDPNDSKYLGFGSWDEFFTREFKPDQRPVGDAVIVNACESAPLQFKRNVALSASFSLKGQPYSLIDMLDNDELAPQFAGGTVYQAFLSALSYHRWHSPVDGVIEKAYVVDGTYYLESAEENIYSKHPDPSAANASQPFITSVATRGIVFIRADDPDLGMVAMVLVGMAEVSSCEIMVVEGQIVKRGDQIGMFHFGGSTHCLVFQSGVNLKFLVDVCENPNLDATNVAVKSNLARLRSTYPLNGN